VIAPGELLSFSDYFAHLMFVMAALLALLSALLLAVGARIVTRPIERWVEKVRSIQNDNLDITFDESPCYEIEEMNLGLGYLVGQLKRLLTICAMIMRISAGLRCRFCSSRSIRILFTTPSIQSNSFARSANVTARYR
jgi:HAMP domain-containing protein